SFYRTREEWDEEQRRFEEWSRKFDEEQRERKAVKPDVVWQRSYVNTEALGDSPQMVLFALGAHLAELTQDLKDAAADQGLIDELNRVFGNLSDVVQQSKPDLIEPVARRLCDSLALIGENHAELAVKCDDLEQQLDAFVRKLTGEPDWDEEMPF
ncbi:MAG TPA: hypothetical protein VE988_18355, partial [Gemmataceae bacterium]|nr:hypothetical protein [Gemmataceae bacterium]